MEQSKFKQLLSRYTKGKANETETALVDAWYKSYQSNESETQVNSDEKASIKKSLIRTIRKSETNQAKTIIPFYYRIAAAIAVICTAGIVIHNWKAEKTEIQASYNLISTKQGQIKKVILADSSIVWLNANSRLRVNTNFEDTTREVFLDEGEAFFKVTKNPNRPFIVRQRSVSVKVLGTSFNVKAYKALANLKVVVSTGKVQVKSREKFVLLTPNQQAIYNYGNHNFSTNKVNEGEANLWREGKFYLHQASFKELAVTMANNFNINLKSASAKANNYQFTLNITKGMTETEILKIISAIHNSRYRKEGNTVILY